MSLHFFHKLNSSNVIETSIVVDSKDCFVDNVYNENKGIEFCNSLNPGKWVGHTSDVVSYSGEAAVGSTFDGSYFKIKSPHSSFIWNENIGNWENPIANPEPNNKDCFFNFTTGTWTKVIIDLQNGTIRNDNWDSVSSSWIEDPNSVSSYDPNSLPPNPYQ